MSPVKIPLKEQRQNIKFGLTIGEWISFTSLTVFLVTGLLGIWISVSKAATDGDNRSKMNKVKIEEFHDRIDKKIKESEQRLKDDLGSEINVVRDDIRELRVLIINRSNGNGSN